MKIDARLDGIVAREQELSALLSGGQDLSSDDLVRYSKEYAELKPVIGAIAALRGAEAEAADLAEMIAAADTEAEMRELAEEEFAALKEEIPKLDGALKILLLPKDEADEKNAILEIRAGTGGDEAALFAADLMRMYQRYAENKKWRAEVMSLSDTGIGGVKEVVIEIGGRGAFARLKYESGAARAGDRSERAYPHLGGDRRGAARGGGGRSRHRGQGSQDRCLPRLRAGRAKRQYHRQRGAHDPSADRYRRHPAGRKIAAQEPRQGAQGSARAAL